MKNAQRSKSSVIYSLTGNDSSKNNEFIKKRPSTPLTSQPLPPISFTRPLPSFDNKEILLDLLGAGKMKSYLNFLKFQMFKRICFLSFNY
jgi:hypothetical protein